MIIYDKDQGNQLVKWLKNNTITEDIIEQLLFIILFRQIIESSDTNLTNILIESDKLLSIDENHSKGLKLNVFFSHHQKKELTDLIDKYIKKNEDTIIDRLIVWKQQINDITKHNPEQFDINPNYKWNEKLISNIDDIKEIIKTKTYVFK